MSQERDTYEAPKPTITSTATGSLTTGFKNYRQTKYTPKEKDPATTYTSKYPSKYAQNKRSASKDQANTYKSSALTHPYQEQRQKVENDPDLHELDEK